MGCCKVRQWHYVFEINWIPTQNATNNVVCSWASVCAKYIVRSVCRPLGSVQSPGVPNVSLLLPASVSPSCCWDMLMAYQQSCCATSRNTGLATPYVTHSPLTVFQFCSPQPFFLPRAKDHSQATCSFQDSCLSSSHSGRIRLPLGTGSVL